MEPENERSAGSSTQPSRQSTRPTTGNESSRNVMRAGLLLVVVVVLAAAVFWFTQRDSTTTSENVNAATDYVAITNTNVPASEYKMVIVETTTKEPQTSFNDTENVSVELSFRPREDTLGEQKVRLHLVNKNTGQSAYDNTLPALDVDEPVVISFSPDLEPATYVAVLSMNDLVLGDQEFVVE